jgi:methylenetetrahydrofolate--tRNA-(uracil-5-)-methyltransferase
MKLEKICYRIKVFLGAVHLMNLKSKIQNLVKESSIESIVVGGGLAGSECAWQLAEQGRKVLLIEQRPVRSNAAHTGPLFAELVCSNSLKSKDPESAPALLKAELVKLQSLILKAAQESEVPAGQALAVDREKFSRSITQAIEAHPHISILREPVTSYEELRVEKAQGTLPVVLATGPLTSEDLAKSLAPLIGDRLYFYDAIAPIVAGESINKEIAFEQNRYDKNLSGVESSSPDGDYLNCPFSEEEYYNFIEEIKKAEKVEAHSFEKLVYFQGCQPIEAILEKGDRSLLFGPMKPVGLSDPRTGQRPYAVLQLRKEDNEGRAWSLVGFQTKLKYGEQKRIFSMIPGLEKAEFYRMGSLHRNTFIHSPSLLDSAFRVRKEPWLHFAGQITGVEGYLESCAIGALVGRLIALRLRGIDAPPPPPAVTALGALTHAIVNGSQKNFQPMNINWGLVPLNGIGERDKEKKKKLVERGTRQFDHWMALFS